jgi:hypothetical protein
VGGGVGGWCRGVLDVFKSPLGRGVASSVQAWFLFLGSGGLTGVEDQVSSKQVSLVQNGFHLVSMYFLPTMSDIGCLVIISTLTVDPPRLEKSALDHRRPCS